MHQHKPVSEFYTEDHLLPVPELLAKYETNPEHGLTNEEATARLLKYGPNCLKQMKPPSRLKIFLTFMFGGFAGLLWIGAVLSLFCYLLSAIKGEPEKEQLFLAAVLIMDNLTTGSFGYFQEASSITVMEGFRKMIPKNVRVIRSGEYKTLDAENVVIGDIVELVSGGVVPADVRLIESNGLKVDNSTITGECIPLVRKVEHTDPNPLETANLVFFGTFVVEGSGLGVIIATGDDTFIGHIAEITSQISKEPLMKKELRSFIYIITIISLTFGLAFLGLAIGIGYSLVDAFIYCIAIVVANVPEGLLVTLTACLTITGKKMAAKNCLVKSLNTVETLGATSVICSDKTGTLTQNKMSIAHIYYNDKVVDLLSPDFYPDPSMSFNKLCRVAILCSQAHYNPTDRYLPAQLRRVIGNASEVAIFQCMERIVGDIKEKRFANPKVCEIPFNSTNKFHVTIVVKRDEQTHHLTMKGAPEVILSRCTHVFIGSQTEEIEPHLKAIKNAIFEMSNMGERVLGFCDLPLSTEEYPKGYNFDPNDVNFPLEGLRFVGLMSMLDPPKEGVYEAVQKCKEAGIKVCMVTGDHPVTASSIGKKVGILSPEKRTIYEMSSKLEIPTLLLSAENLKEITAVVVTGSELRDMSNEELDDIVSYNDEIIFARTTPTQKLHIVQAFQRIGEIVAVTGDGVNDAAALKQADIGISMGISGSDVSKEAADMILLDDNFSTIVKGVEEGRIIFDNLKKSIAYVLTSNSPELMPFILYVAINMPITLTSIAMMMINVGTDLWPALSLAYEKGEADIMQRKPRDVNRDKLVNYRLICFSYILVGFLQAAASFTCYFTVMAQYGFMPSRLMGIRKSWEDKSNNDLLDSYGVEWSYIERQELERKGIAAYFLGIVITQIADAIISKSRRLSVLTMGMHNWVMNIGLMFEVFLALVVVYTPHLNTALTFSPVHWTAILPAVPYGILIIVLDEIRRYYIRQNPTGWLYRETYF